MVSIIYYFPYKITEVITFLLKYYGNRNAPDGAVRGLTEETGNCRRKDPDPDHFSTLTYIKEEYKIKLQV